MQIKLHTFYVHHFYETLTHNYVHSHTHNLIRLSSIILWRTKCKVHAAGKGKQLSHEYTHLYERTNKNYTHTLGRAYTPYFETHKYMHILNPKPLLHLLRIINPNP